MRPKIPNCLTQEAVVLHWSPELDLCALKTYQEVLTVEEEMKTN